MPFFAIYYSFGWNCGFWWTDNIQINGYWQFEIQKTYSDKTNYTLVSWWYMKVLWNEMVGLWRKLSIIYNTLTFNPQPQKSGVLVLIAIDLYFCESLSTTTSAKYALFFWGGKNPQKMFLLGWTIPLKNITDFTSSKRLNTSVLQLSFLQSQPLSISIQSETHHPGLQSHNVFPFSCHIPPFLFAFPTLLCFPEQSFSISQAFWQFG